MVDRLPRPTCCADGARFVALRFADDVIYAEHPDRDAAIASYGSVPPRWTITAIPADGMPSSEAVVVVACPFCGAVLPGIRPRAKPPRRVAAVIDGGYYCATCERRLNECRCAPPERMWEIAARPAPAPPSASRIREVMADTARREEADRRRARRPRSRA